MRIYIHKLYSEYAHITYVHDCICICKGRIYKHSNDEQGEVFVWVQGCGARIKDRHAALADGCWNSGRARVVQLTSGETHENSVAVRCI